MESPEGLYEYEWKGYLFRHPDTGLEFAPKSDRKWQSIALFDGALADSELLTAMNSLRMFPGAGIFRSGTP